jgi:hypothetical protein
MAGRRSSGRLGIRRPVAVVGSVIFHAALLVILARYLAQTTQYAETPTIQVSLVPAPARPDEPEIAEATPPDRPDRDAPMLPDRPAPVTDGSVAPRFAGEVAPGADDAEAVRHALRRLEPCDRGRPGREARERCEARRWAGGPAVTARLNLDPSGRYAVDPEPFLSKRPTKGCRLRATGDVGPFGDDANAKAGFTCVKPF